MEITGFEGFEGNVKTNFNTGETYTSRIGLKYTLTTDTGNGATPSGFRDPVKDGFGDTELVVGDLSRVKIGFGRNVEKFSLKYYVITDYTEKDLADEFPDQVGKIDLSKITTKNFDLFYTLRFIGNKNDETYTGPIATLPSEVTFNEFPFHTLEISTTRAGTAHFDVLRWTQSASI
ncbi:hypothetical protein [Pseudomonas fontis]|uniref:Uncharacterized protein n=1 Tax=Pseudomonas fontis TaxID=2942633 RepID=A0ABT5NNM5_9PSED|nr:hypothetical protein [Pseudomonas fontis]MDD0976007.1 hypothetical protein [Pseudomonas fontis]MDD0989759.1 hypothetical protein [Pseudomonas fontis]